MSDDTWFRRKTWTDSDRTEFTARLRRSRGAFHKAQYARIQSYELMIVGAKDALRGAIELLDLILSEWRSEADLAAVYHQYAQCVLSQGDEHRSIEFFRNSFQAQRQQPGHITDAHLNFGWLCVTSPIPELYAEAISVLDEFQYPAVFPIHIYRDATIRALIFASKQERELARKFALIALNASAVTRSQLSHHPTLGVVVAASPDIQSRLREIAA